MQSLADILKETIEKIYGKGKTGPKRKFTMVPTEILIDPKATREEKMVYIILLFFKYPNQECFPGEEVISKILKISKRQIIRDIKSLNHKGFIQIYKKGRRNAYRFLK